MLRLDFCHNVGAGPFHGGLSTASRTFRRRAGEHAPREGESDVMLGRFNLRTPLSTSDECRLGTRGARIGVSLDPARAMLFQWKEVLRSFSWGFSFL